MTDARVSQVVTEVLSTTVPDAQLSQIVVEVLSTTVPDARISQVVIEVLSSVAVNPNLAGSAACVITATGELSSASTVPGYTLRPGDRIVVNNDGQLIALQENAPIVGQTLRSGNRLVVWNSGTLVGLAPD